MNDESLLKTFSLTRKVRLLKKKREAVFSKTTNTTIRSFVLHCGAVTMPEMVGSSIKNSDGWDSGILFEIVKDLVQVRIFFTVIYRLK